MARQRKAKRVTYDEDDTDFTTTNHGRNRTTTTTTSRRKERNRDVRSSNTERSRAKFSHEPKYNIELKAMTAHQQELLASLVKDELIIARGAAGTGKTYLSVKYACRELFLGNIDKIIITRSNIPTGKSLGFFPGTLEEKLMPWLAQIVVYMEEFLGGNRNTIECMMRNNQLLLVPFETMRGRSFENSVTIVDEAQNLHMTELKCVTTRIGANSKIVLCGDTTQSDLIKSDFDLFISKLVQYQLPHVGIVNFTFDDCVRSGLCKQLLKMFDQERL